LEQIHSADVKKNTVQIQLHQMNEASLWVRFYSSAYLAKYYFIHHFENNIYCFKQQQQLREANIYQKVILGIN
jgi:hypothetical protein